MQASALRARSWWPARATMVSMSEALYFYDELRAVVAKLNADGIEYAVCEGVALALHGFPRTTKDIDVLIQLDDLIRVTKAVNGLGFISLGPFTEKSGKHERSSPGKVWS